MKCPPQARQRIFQLYVHHPSRGTFLGERFRARYADDSFRVAQHSDIEERFDLPDHGEAFDRMTRGAAEINFVCKQVLVDPGRVAAKYDHHDVVQTFCSAYRGWTVRHKPFEHRTMGSQ